MDRFAILSFFAALLAAGCGNTMPLNTYGDAYDDNVTVPEEAYLGYVEATAPEGTLGNFLIDGEPAISANGTPCAYVDACVAELAEPDDRVSVDFDCPDHGFVYKTQDGPANGETITFSWNEPGDWSVKASGLYLDQWGRELLIEVYEYDFDDDGNAERVINGDPFHCTQVFDHDSFTGTCQYGDLTSDVSGWFDGLNTGYYLANYSDGQTVEYDLELIEAYDEE
jgi:hypothetical protein